MYAILAQLASPFLLLFLALGLCVGWLVRTSRAARYACRCCLAAYILLWLFCTPAVSHFTAMSIEHLSPPLEHRPSEAQAIVVLGVGVIPPAAPDFRTHLGDRTLRRCLKAAELYHDGPPLPVLATGGKVDKSKPGDTEAVAMKQLLLRLGVPDDRILTETRSIDTYENAVYSQQQLAARRIDHILLVTDAAHMPRASALFRKRGLTVIPAPSHYFTSEFSWDLFAFLPNLSAADINSAIFHEHLGTLWSTLRQPRT
jgi:uncharacterized SAM-binding protein YcdF (DUF218 family)